MHKRLSVHSVCFLGASLPEFFEQLRALDARRLSLASAQFPPDGPTGLRKLLAAGGQQIESITHRFLSSDTLETGASAWPAARAALLKLVDDAVELGARSIYMLTGGAGSLAWEQAADSFASGIAPCLAHARDAGIELMIENTPSLYADYHIAHNLRDTITLAETAGIGVCIDLHSCWTEAGLHASILRAMPRCHLVQLGDYVLGDRSLPARAVPGDGAIPIKTHLAWLLEAGYTGAFELEQLGPRIDKEGHRAATQRAAERLGEMLLELGA